MKSLIACVLAVMVSSAVAHAESAGEPGRDSKQPNPLKNVYFGEQHMHTADSPAPILENELYSAQAMNACTDLEQIRRGGTT